MKTTLNVDDDLVRRAKQRAAALGTTFTAVVEDALRAALVEPDVPESFTLALPTVRGDAPPAADLADRDALEDAMGASGREPLP